jgi:predicted AAA+ superfamily ATPase
MRSTPLSLHHWPREENAQFNFESLDDLEGRLPHNLLNQLKHLPDLVERGLSRGVILRGMRGSGQLEALKALADSMGRDVLYLQRPDEADLPSLCRLLGPMAVLRGALPIIEMELAPGAQVTLPPLAGYKGLFGLILTHEGSVVGPQVEGCITLEVPAAKGPARQQQWEKVLGGRGNGHQPVIDTVSQNYHLTLGTVTQAGPLAQAYAALQGREQVAVADVQSACRALNQQSLENLANRVPTQFDDDRETEAPSSSSETGLDLWDRLIISPQTRCALETLVQRCRHRETLLNHLGPGFAGTSRGVKALFSGVSGTGKTLAARIVAAQLGLDLYRVDLSSVISKYIGETERNLSQLFARAEEQDIVLLLDEGDSLLTSRTDVSNSNDRYANMETNYLLQRLEQYDGIILITTNVARNIDTAFQRRIDVSIDFNLPDAEQRYDLWRLHLPDAQKQAVSEPFLHEVALRCQLSGGQIRNAALHATVLAVDQQTKINDEFLKVGIQREYSKIGASAPLN